MSVPHIIIRNSENFRGIDKRSSDLKRTMEFATDVKNAAFRVSGAINKRKGFHTTASSSISADETSYGTFTYRQTSADGSIAEEVLMVNDKIRQVQECVIHLVNNRTSVNTTAGEDVEILIAHYLNKSTGTFVFKISDVANEAIYFSADLGTGNNSSDMTIATLLTNINNEANLNIAATSLLKVDSSSITADTPAAYMSILQETLISEGASSDIDFTKFINKVSGQATPSSTIFPSYQSTDTYVASTDLIENISAVQLNSVMYLSNGQDPVMKYDGTHVYRAGLPGLVETPIPGSWAYTIDTNQEAGGLVDTISIHDVSGTNADLYNHDDRVAYKFVIEYTDAQGNLVQSQPSDPIIATFNQTHGYSQITWEDYIFNGLNKIPSTASEDSPLKVQIYKSITGTTGTDPDVSGLFYHIGTVPWDNDTGVTVPFPGPTDPTTVRFIDDTIDLSTSTAGVDFLKDPIKRRDPPPLGRYLTTFQSCLVLSGQNENVNNLQFSTPGGASLSEIGSEYFPDDDNAVIIESSFGDRISAIAPLRDLLYVFHKNSIHVLGGDITSPSGVAYSVELLTKEGGIGCTSFSSIVEFRGQLLFLSESGMYAIDSKNALSEMSSLIKPFFQDKSLVKKRAVAFNWNDQNLILLHIPKETTGVTGQAVVVSTDKSLTLAYDTYKDAWLKWDGLDFSGGMTSVENNIFFTSRELNVDLYASFKLSTFNNTNTTYDYSDHEKAIEFEYETNWESLGDPTVPKKFLRAKLYAMDTDLSFETPGFDLDVAVQKDFFNFDVGVIPFDFGGGRDLVGWGADPWGAYPWGGPPNQFFKSKLPAGKSKCVKLKFANDKLLQNVLITNYELEIAAPFSKEIKE